MKKYKPTSPSKRQMTTISYRGVLTASEPLKKLTYGRKRAVGRGSAGEVTTPHKGGGVKRLYRMIDFKFDKKDIPAKIVSVEYDPNRSGFIGLAVYADGEKRYVLLAKGLKVGDSIVSGQDVPVKYGNRLPISKLPVGTFVFNIETKPNAGAVLIRSAGSYAQVVAQDGGMTQIKMPSGEIRKIIGTCWATVGEVSNSDYRLQNIGKAGRNRKRGVRPTVRGTAMNPVDHPHGGGEGRQGIALRKGPKTRQGKPAYGVKTRRPKKYSNVFIVEKRKNKRNQPK
ncbi:MAG TPA: 50S ribosomal protein L2 [Candidatus Paceibacterota bacterium]|nr:50S ribosomal protein L2 [Candidatus Paceibacterota bacterium]HMP19196.1 50S ribosomal protein L2 [Candidatus Paceibacterota bacterium]HMP85273.1 50S ribosomal protein L2 [Candidatus Paceibacterota bacterium]